MDQRDERKGYMAGVDMALAKTEERVQKRKQLEEFRRFQEDKRNKSKNFFGSVKCWRG